MKTGALTDIKIRKIASPQARRLEVADGKFPGLTLRVSKNGVKSFALRTRVDGKQIRVTLGQYPDVTLAAARAKAHKVVAEAKKGNGSKLGPTPQILQVTFEFIVSEYLERHAKRYMKERSYLEARRILIVEFVKLWGKRSIAEITKQNIVAAVNDIFNRRQYDGKRKLVKSESPSAANHAFGAIRAFFSWGLGQGIVEINPCTGLRSPAPKTKRNRVLDDKELGKVWHAATEIGYPYGSIIRLLIATVQRRSEVACLRWDMINWDEQEWKVPAEENKSGREYIVPLSGLSLKILQNIPKVDDRLIFPAQRSNGKVFGDWSKSKHRINQISGVYNWTVHDLRRTGSTNLARLGVAPHVKERVLNHLTGELGGVAGVYDVYSYLPEKRAALDLWADRLDELVVG